MKRYFVLLLWCAVARGQSAELPPAPQTNGVPPVAVTTNLSAPSEVTEPVFISEEPAPPATVG